MLRFNKNTKLILLFIVVFTIISPILLAQPFNNSWINYNQQYYKFKIAETGIYKIDSTTLFNAGIPLNTINPKNFQIFARGQEIPIHIEGENDGVFNTTDFIEFYAQHNNGWLDQVLYGGAANHPNPYYSLTTDTISYFLTWNNTTNNLRFSLETDTSFSVYTPTNFVLKENVEIYTQGNGIVANPYYDGETVSVGGSSVSLFGYASTEGWFDLPIELGNSKTKTINTKNAYLFGTNAKLNAVVTGQSDNTISSSINQHLGVTIGSSAWDTIFSGYKKIDVNRNIPINQLGNNTTDVIFTNINDLGATSARQAIAYIKLTYPHTLDFEGNTTFSSFFVEDEITQTKSYLNFTNLNTTGNVLFYDLTNRKKITVVSSGGTFSCLIPNSGVNKECYATSSGQVKQVTQLQPINNTGFFVNHAQNPIDTAFIIITHQSLMSSALDYATYRLNPGPTAQPQNPVIFDVDDIYNQFSFGVEKHPIAIRNFLNYLLTNWNSTPNYLFLLGKSIKAKEIRKNTTNFKNCLVPSYGNPASDNMLTIGLNGSLPFEPAIPTGRLAAKNNTEVDWYLNKVQQHENPTFGSNGETKWMKQFLHFGGGTDAGQQSTFLTFINGYKTTIEDTLFGGTVTTFTKTTTAPVQISISDSIKNFIGNGVAWMTFLGHASATGGFDQNIDAPAQWPNQNGKYPILMGLACFSGDVHLPSANSTSEEHVILDNKGVIGFLSSVDLGLTNTLNIYASELYRNISQKSYGETIGRQIKNTMRTITTGTGTDIKNFTNSVGLNVSFHGDPAIKLNTFDKPDYMINNQSVNFSPTPITSDLDSFNVVIEIANLGKAIDSTIVVSLTRSFPSNNFSDTTYLKSIPAPLFQSTVTFKLPVDVVKGLGINTLSVLVDAPPLFIDELSETNNSVTKTVNIISGNIIPIYPYNFSIVPNQGVTLKASTAFPFQTAKNYIFEVDTTDYFNSPIKERIVINHFGGVVNWTPNLLQNMPDSMVYFWRVSKDSVDATGFSWLNRSFQYIKDKEGWQQDHFFQFENNQLNFVNHSRATRQFNFQNKMGTLWARTNGAIGSPVAGGGTNWNDGSFPSYFIDQNRVGGNGVGANSAVHVAVVDTISFDFWKANQMPLGQGGGTSSFFRFENGNAAQMNALANMLNDSVPNGYYVIMWSWYWHFLWSHAPLPAAVNNALTNLGATQLANIQDDKLPFVVFAKKGFPAQTVETIGDSIAHKNISASGNIVGTSDFATITSPIFGPATSWDSLSWRMSALESPSTKDSSTLNVIGVDANGNETVLIANLPTDSGDIRLTNQINAAQFPYLKVSTTMYDDSLGTVPQLDRWQITYSDIPEAALDPATHFSFQKDTVNEGERVFLSIAIRNISRHDMDSLLISFAVLNKFNNLIPLPFPRQKPLLADSVMLLNFDFSTFGMAGINSLLIDVNPNNDQLEKHHFNNVAEIQFFVVDDKINPLLDVTFDGSHILNGDIVSPNTEIVVELKDENKFLLLNDTSDFAVWITTPDGFENKINFTNSVGQEIMQFIPASLPKNSAKIIYRAAFNKDGGYKLRIQANDISKNESGSNDYLIGFEVIQKSTITNIINYPNPFTTSTRFVFTLTGSKVPDIFKIQIITITGKVVREIHKEELGHLKIGQNITDFAWDGTDRYGDRLANGLYLYRVITKIDNDDLELRETSMDWYFKKGYGKMYLFR